MATKIRHKDPLQQLKDIEQQQFIGYWLKSKGLTLKTLEKHKQIDDIILLINVKGAYRKLYNNSQNGYWAALWDRCLNKKKPLRQKDLDKLENNTLQALQKQRSRQQRTAKARHKIKQLRENANKSADDMTTKAAEPSIFEQ